VVTKSIAHGLFLCGTYMVTALHVFGNTTDYVEIEGVGGQITRVSGADVIRHITPSLKERELIIIEFKCKLLKMYRDITDMLYTEDNYFKGDVPFGRITIDHGTTLVEEAKVHQFFDFAEPQEEYEVDILGDKVTRKAISVRIRNGAQLCGSPYFTLINSTGPTILGFHIAGSQGHSLFAVLTKEDVKFLKKKKEVLDPDFESEGMQMKFHPDVGKSDIEGFQYIGYVEKPCPLPLKSDYRLSEGVRTDPSLPFENKYLPASAYVATPALSLRKRIGFVQPSYHPAMGDPDCFRGVFREDLVHREFEELSLKQAILGTEALPSLDRDASGGPGMMNHSIKRIDVVDFEKGELKEPVLSAYTKLREEWSTDVKRSVWWQDVIKQMKS